MVVEIQPWLYIGDVITTLATLTGTPNQIAWAEELRATAMAAFEADSARLSGPPRAVELFREILARITEATAWIDNRDYKWNLLVKAHITDEELAEMQTLRAYTKAGS